MLTSDEESDIANAIRLHKFKRKVIVSSDEESKLPKFKRLRKKHKCHDLNSNYSNRYISDIDDNSNKSSKDPI